MTSGPRESAETKALLDDFAIRSLRDMADNDYVLARMAIRAELGPQFLWSSLQAIEKYLKAILLINRVPSTKPTHNLAVLVAKAEGIKKLRFSISGTTRAFVEFLDEYGRFRYLEVSYHVKARDLVMLDLAAWDIRRYCARLDYSLAKGGKEVSVLEYELGRIERASRDRRDFRWFSGELEKIIANRKHPARPWLIWKNVCFGARLRKTIKLTEWFRSVNAPLALHNDLFEEVRKYVFLPKDLVDEFEALLKKRHKPDRGQPAGCCR